MPSFNTGIYSITNLITGRVYIGSAGSLSDRRQRHWYSLRTGSHWNKHIQRAWTKYGESAFCFAPLLYCAKSDLVLYEQRALDILWSTGNLYNLSPSADCPNRGVKPSDEARAKMRAANSRHMLGKQHTPESKAKISTSKKGQLPWITGLTHAESSKEKMRATKRETKTRRLAHPEEFPRKQLFCKHGHPRPEIPERWPNGQIKDCSECRAILDATPARRANHLAASRRYRLREKVKSKAGLLIAHI